MVNRFRSRFCVVIPYICDCSVRKCSSEQVQQEVLLQTTSVLQDHGGTAPRFNLGAICSDWSASRPGPFTPEEKAPGTHFIGGWVDPSAGLDAVVKR